MAQRMVMQCKMRLKMKTEGAPESSLELGFARRKPYDRLVDGRVPPMYIVSSPG